MTECMICHERPVANAPDAAACGVCMLADIRRLMSERNAAEAKLNTPELHDFAKGVVLEAAHQRERWGTDHDGGKAPADWFWLIGYLAGKALHAHAEGRHEKALHHTITAASAFANWHAEILGKTNMRPGIEPPLAAQRRAHGGPMGDPPTEKTEPTSGLEPETC